MFRLFKKRKPADPGAVQSKVAHTIAVIQCAITMRLNKATSRWNRRAKICFLAIFTSVMITLSVLQFNYPLFHPPAGNSMDSAIRKGPTLKSSPYQRAYRSDSALFASFLQRLHQLKASPEGRDSLARFEKKRPGFIDSVLQWGNKIHPNP
ncbi:hypothetical protein WJU16_02855 [Chitinophaga pollutisoli]|uniref:Uncharacterized protein n=1 Tax=Chitinophaga pollutisoli TaxID=3133966 RepID=A0ABZ2YT09_9BACT